MALKLWLFCVIYSLWLIWSSTTLCILRAFLLSTVLISTHSRLVPQSCECAKKAQVTRTDKSRDWTSRTKRSTLEKEIAKI
ncbi:hypothetical protein K438DRAFT_1800587 [Mycena galopus ATCC 62051]|nr:hypothetical protein K438DRAFT_1800587 [Mycena galopus ATCC 62051]